MAQTGMLMEDFDVEAVLQDLTPLQKAKLVAGSGMAHSGHVPEQGLHAYRMCDGPQGPRGLTVHNATPANCFPCEMALGASFDRALVSEIATHYAAEARSKLIHVMMAPTVNLARSPLGGRGFETFGEDPYHSGQMAIDFVRSLQAQNIGACLKHLVGNEQEYEKHLSDSVISPRALREVYLEPFRAVIKEADPWAVMPAYNKLDNVHCSENKWLLETVLRKEWGYQGLTVSDFYGVHDAAASIVNGCDIEMPDAFHRNTDVVTDLLTSGKISMEDLDARVRPNLLMLKRTLGSKIPYGHVDLEKVETVVDDDTSRSLLRKGAAASVVLLKNDASLLPIRSSVKQIAVVGPCADTALTSGGGAASTPYEVFKTTPLAGIRSKALDQHITVKYSPGAIFNKYTPPFDPHMRHPDSGQLQRAKMEFWKEEPAREWKGRSAELAQLPDPDHVLNSRGTRCFMHDGLPRDIVEKAHHVKVTLDFVPPHGGDWQIGVTSGGLGHLWVDGQLVVDYVNDLEDGTLFFNYCYKEKIAVLKNVEAGRAYRVEYRCWAGDRHYAFPVPMSAGFQLGAAPFIPEDRAIADAVALAVESDLTIVVVGLGKDVETEGYDRDTMDLPGPSDALVDALLSATPNLIIVTQSGLPITMPWADKASSMVHQFYGGSDCGGGLASVLFGEKNPDAKLPITFPRRFMDSPSALGFGKGAASFGKAYYQEDIYIGHRYYDRAGIAPLFPFGHGLSYTTFEYSRLEAVRRESDTDFTVSFTITNTGEVAGAEIAQVYVGDLKCDFARPIRELKGFVKVYLEPGASQVAAVSLDRDSFKFWDNRHRHCWVAEAGDFEIAVGPSSASLPLRCTVELGKTTTWRGL